MVVSVCEQMKLGVTSFFSAAPDRSAENMLRSFSDRFQIPYISASHFPPPPHSPSSSSDMGDIVGDIGGGMGAGGVGTEEGGGIMGGMVPVAHEWSVNIRPFFTKAVLALQKKLKWDKITYITDTLAGTAAVKDILSGQCHHTHPPSEQASIANKDTPVSPLLYPPHSMKQKGLI